MTLKNIIFLMVSDPPDPISNLDRMMSICVFKIVDGIGGHVRSYSLTLEAYSPVRVSILITSPL